MTEHEAKRYLEYLGVEPQNSQSVPMATSVRGRRLFRLAVAILLVLLLVAVIIAATTYTVAHNEATMATPPTLKTNDARSYTVSLADRIDGQEECRKFGVLFRIFLYSIMEGLLAQ